MTKKNILIDLDRLKDVNTGLGHVAAQLGKTLSEIKDEQLHFTFLVPQKYDGFFGKNVDYEIVSARRRYFPTLCKNYDLWYTIHQDSFYFPAFNKTPYIITINDLNFLGEKSPGKIKKRLKRLQKKVNKATIVTTISKYTETTVRENLDVKNKPIHTIYCGVTVEEFANAERPKFAPEGDLLFSVGVVQPKKNSMALVEFMKYLPENYKLIIAGNKSHPYAAEIEAKVHELGLNNRIFLPGLISDEDKYWMLKNCKAVLFPSKFEGMGFPPIEAMRLGKPVFASTFSSIPEVSENNAYYWGNFEPKYMSDFFLEKMTEFKSNPEKPAQLIQHSLKYTWKNNAKSYIELFKKVLSI